MKIKKFNEELTDYSDYKEYDEYSYIDIDIINNWNTDFLEVNNFLSNFTHEIKKHSEFINEYVVCSKNRDLIIIPSEIKIKYDNAKNEFITYFYDTYNSSFIKTTSIKYIKNIKEIAETDQILFLKLYKTYIEEYKAPYMNIFGKKEFEHLLNSKKYNL